MLKFTNSYTYGSILEPITINYFLDTPMYRYFRLIVRFQCSYCRVISLRNSFNGHNLFQKIDVLTENFSNFSDEAWIDFGVMTNTGNLFFNKIYVKII